MSTENLRSLAASLAAFLLIAVPVAASTAIDSDRTVGTDGSAMPAMLRLALARSQAADAAAAYHLDRAGRGANPRHGLELAFTSAGARIEGGHGGFALRLERFGRGAGRPVSRTAPSISGAWVEYDRGAGLSEWFVNLPRGVEHGWTVTESPAGNGALVLELDTARPPDEDGDGRLAWSGLVYHRLVALDAAGRELSAAWTRDGTHLRIEVDDRDAAYPLLIDPWVEQAKLVADDGAEFDAFGWSVAIDGDTALVGAPGAAVDGNDFQGAAYVFTRSEGTWSFRTRLTSDDGGPFDSFGDSVALDGDTALVGAGSASTPENTFQGVAYVFTESDGVWSQQAKLIADDGAAADFFGTVALAGDTALVGALGADGDGGFNQGAVYIFTESDGVWSQRDKLTADDGAEDDQFGIAVALMGDTALVGARGAVLDGNVSQGAAYVFTESGGEWSQQAKLLADDGAELDEFGFSVALAGDTALVGAPDGFSHPGAAYIFTRSGDTWSQQAKLTAADGSTGERFGGSVALAGDTALVGAFVARVGDDFEQGAAYVFTRRDGVWSQRTKLTASDGAATDHFGQSVAFAGDTALMGARQADVDGNANQGAAYAFAFTPPLAPASIEVDFTPLASSDGNDVFEPGEQVEVAPGWRNGEATEIVGDGVLSSFTGPEGGTYDISEGSVSYGPISPGETGSCRDSGSGCYRLDVQMIGAGRPAQHWDASVDEEVETAEDLFTHTWTLHLGDSFADVPRSSPFYPAIETLLHSAVTGGCEAGDAYCPGSANTRAQMPVFMLRALLGADYTPPPCVEGDEPFDDVPVASPFCPWIQDLAGGGIVSGCGGGDYCPSAPVTRAQMSIFLLKTLEGPAYEPPDCTDVFTDVPCPSVFADWIEDLAARDITGGCAPNRYCPADPVTRAQMAVFVTRTFGFTLYGP